MIEEVAGAVKDLIKAGTMRQFGMSEAAAGTIRLQRPAAHARKVGDHWQPKERRGPSDQQADGEADTAAPDAVSSTGVSGRGRLARSDADRLFGTGVNRLSAMLGQEELAGHLGPHLCAYCRGDWLLYQLSGCPVLRGYRFATSIRKGLTSPA